jgi:uncharacterized membrane protein
MGCYALPISKVTSLAREVSLVAVFTALVAVATATLSVSVPATRGYFNIGETVIYVSAILFGASVGGLSAGIGAMIADLLLGYGVYAPATLVVKGIEGALVGFLAKRKIDRILGTHSRRPLAFIAAIALAGIVLIVGATYYSGPMQFAFASPVAPVEFGVTVPTAFWVLLSIIVAATTLYVSLKTDPNLSWQIVAVLVGGSEMVAGYFLYEQLILGVAAVVEIPFNVGQMMVGAIVAIPLVRAIRARIPNLLNR